MTDPLDELKKDLEALRSRIEVWETTFEEDLKAKGDVDEERAAALPEFPEDVSDRANMDVVHGGDTQSAPGNKRKRPEMQVPSTTTSGTKDTTLHHQASVIKRNATLEQRIEILDWHHANGRNQTRTAKHFDAVYPNLKIKQPLVSNWVKDESRWREEWENSHGCPTAKRTRRITSKSSSPSSSIPLSPSSTLNDPTDPIVKIEDSDDLAATGAHQTVNTDESGTMGVDEVATDNEIYHTVMDSQEAPENGTEGVGNSNNVDDDMPRDYTRRPRPTRREALQAALVLKRYLAAIDDPFARKMEATLNVFICQMRLIEARRNLKPTLLTDYFPRK